ncbi:MAG: signal peptide peptidase SppA [Candidatus Poribacteria bacterium]|nr:signal peptide peptidase SppA [Candidatus Poribacteria bacterium]
MKPLKTLWQTVVPVFLIIFFVLPVSAEEQTEEEAAPPVKKYVEFTLSGTYTDIKEMSFFGTSSTKTLRGLFKKLDALKNNDEVAGVIFKIGNIGIGWASLQEVRNKLDEFKDAEKEMIAYLESGGNAQYLLATAMDRIVLMPTGNLNLIGLRAEILFYKGLLEKLDVEADMLAMGEFKSGIEPFTREDMSDAFRESMTGLLDDLYAQLLEKIADGRDGITSEIAAELIDRGPFTAKEAQEAKLVDALQYYDELLDTINETPDTQVAKQNDKKKRKVPDMNSVMGLMQLFNMLNPPQRAKARPAENQLALIYASGPILPDFDSPFPTTSIITPKTLKKAFEKARADNAIKAVVLRVNSPGGSAIASDLIWREVVRTQREKPVIVSMANYAASGGYYISMAAGTIVAQPGTLTGSIGVFGGKLNLKGLYNKVGLTKEIITHGQNATLYSDYGSFTETERERVEKMMKTVYEDFVTKAADGRQTTFDEIDAVAQGRVWTGKQAKELGLVDELGGLDTALTIAKKEVGLTDEDRVDIIVLPEQKSFFEQIMESILEEEAGISAPLPLQLAQQHPAISKLNTQWHRIVTWLTLFEKERVVTALPYDILIR